MDYAKVNEALYKKALGYDAEETSEEFGLVDGQLIVVKKKVTTKHYPPDAVALKILCDTEKERNSDGNGNCNELNTMSDSQLQEERINLLAQLEGQIAINAPQLFPPK